MTNRPLILFCAALLILSAAILAGCSATLPVPVTVTPTPLAPTSTPPGTQPPTPTPSPTAPVLRSLEPPTATPPTPLPNAEAIASAVLDEAATEHWVANRVSASFTQPGADERAALVGMIGPEDEMRWVIAGDTPSGATVQAASEILGTGFDAPPPSYLPPETVDFDSDGRRELLTHYFRLQGGWLMGADTLYRYEDGELVRIWGTSLNLTNKAAGPENVAQPYRQSYEADWEWVDLDGTLPDEIRLQENLAFFLPDADGYVPDDAQPVGVESTTRTFRWDGAAFRPYAPGGPSGTFAYTQADALWLWKGGRARLLAPEYVLFFRWSPDGRRLAWVEAAPDQPVALALLDTETETHRHFALEARPTALHWLSDDLIAYALPGDRLWLAEMESGSLEERTGPTPESWSPDGQRFAYVEEQSLYLSNLATGASSALVKAPEGAGDVIPSAVDPIWSPRGDRIALRLENAHRVWVGVADPDAPPLSTLDLLTPFEGREAMELHFAWSPDGEHLAAVTVGPAATTLHLANIPPVGAPTWRTLLALDEVIEAPALAWTPDGTRIALATRQELRLVDLTGESTLRHRFPFPDAKWTSLTWAPDGSGLLAALAPELYEGRLYWLPTAEGDPMSLLTGNVGNLVWGSLTSEMEPAEVMHPPMVLLEGGEEVARLHFVDGEGRETVVPATEDRRPEAYQVGDGRVYVEGEHIGLEGRGALPTPEVLETCQTPLVHPLGQRLAWICYDRLPGPEELKEGTGRTEYRLVVTDGEGNNPAEVWVHIESQPGFGTYALLDWREDGEVVYLTKRDPMMGWAFFNYAPDLVEITLETGQTVLLAEAEDAFESAVSDDGTWFAQTRAPLAGTGPVTLTVRSPAGGVERNLPGAPGSELAGDLSFSPGNGWLAWREVGGGRFLVRAVQLPNGEPLTIYEEEHGESSDIIQPSTIGGWLDGSRLVLVREGGTGASYVLDLSKVGQADLGPGTLLSPHAFLGRWKDDG